MSRRMSFTVIQGGRPDKPRSLYQGDDSNPARGVIIAVALSVPLWIPTYVGLSWLAAWARFVVGGR